MVSDEFDAIRDTGNGISYPERSSKLLIWRRKSVLQRLCVLGNTSGTWTSCGGATTIGGLRLSTDASGGSR